MLCGQIAVATFSFLLYLHPFDTARADQLVQVEYMPAVELDIGASKTANLFSPIASITLAAEPEPEPDCSGR